MVSTKIGHNRYVIVEDTNSRTPIKLVYSSAWKTFISVCSPRERKDRWRCYTCPRLDLGSIPARCEDCLVKRRATADSSGCRLLMDVAVWVAMLRDWLDIVGGVEYNLSTRFAWWSGGRRLHRLSRVCRVCRIPTATGRRHTAQSVDLASCDFVVVARNWSKKRYGRRRFNEGPM